MTYQPYDTYKDSAQTWLGDIPEHWDTRRIKFLFKIKKRIAGTTDWDVLSITQSGIKVKDITSGEGQLAMDYSKYQLVEKNDFAMNHMDLLTGYVDISKYDGVTSPDYRVFTLTDDTQVKEYYLHLFQTGYKNKIFFAFGQGSSQLGRWRLPADEFNNFVVPVPPPKEQKAIAEFIDKKTSQIDAHIVKQEKLIELLKERRTATINKAVTRGLDECVTCKDSGIEWLGEVPEHWEKKQIRRIVKNHKQGFYSTDAYVDFGTKLVRITDIASNSSIDYSQMPYVKIKNNELDVFSIQEGDFLFARTGGVGLFGVVEANFEKAVFASYLIRFRFDETVNRDYLKYFFLSEAFLYGLRNFTHGGVNQNVHAQNIKEQYILIPPSKEQQKIIDFLDNENTKIDNAIDTIKDEIASLREYRQSLISNAVTGKIKVVDNI